MDSFSVTEVLSEISDRLSQRSILQSAKRYSAALQLPEHFFEMLFLVEDKRFPLHLGVDPAAILRALIFDLRGGCLQGASTISQQVYNIRYQRNTARTSARSIGTKFRQAYWATCSTAVFSKVILLREYVETVYWGRSVYGIDEAARAYFGVSRAQLSVAQSFFLAERIAMPNRFSPGRVANLIKRRGVRAALDRGRTSLLEVTQVYQSTLGRGETWQFLER